MSHVCVYISLSPLHAISIHPLIPATLLSLSPSLSLSLSPISLPSPSPSLYIYTHTRTHTYTSLLKKHPFSSFFLQTEVLFWRAAIKIDRIFVFYLYRDIQLYQFWYVIALLCIFYSIYLYFGFY